MKWYKSICILLICCVSIYTLYVSGMMIKF